MAQPIPFREANGILGRPAGMTAEECKSVECFRDGEHCITRWPQRAAWGKRRGQLHRADCQCKPCLGFRASARESLLQQIPSLGMRLGQGHAAPWNLQVLTLEQLWHLFARWRTEYIAEVEAGRITHGG